MTYVLAIETSSAYCSVSLFNEATQIAGNTLPLERGHATVLIPMIQDLLKNTHISLHDLTQVAVGRGPGSFTGLRVGMAAAQGISVSLNIPLKTVTTFEAILEMIAPSSRSHALILIDTKRGDFYACIYKDGKEEISIFTAEQAIKYIQATECYAAIDTDILGDLDYQNIEKIIPTAEGVGKHALRFLEMPTSQELLYIRSPSIT